MHASNGRSSTPVDRPRTGAVRTYEIRHVHALRTYACAIAQVARAALGPGARILAVRPCALGRLGRYQGSEPGLIFYKYFDSLDKLYDIESMTNYYTLKIYTQINELYRSYTSHYHTQHFIHNSIQHTTVYNTYMYGTEKNMMSCESDKTLSYIYITYYSISK